METTESIEPTMKELKNNEKSNEEDVSMNGDSNEAKVKITNAINVLKILGGANFD